MDISKNIPTKDFWEKLRPFSDPRARRGLHKIRDFGKIVLIMYVYRSDQRESELTDDKNNTDHQHTSVVSERRRR